MPSVAQVSNRLWLLASAAFWAAKVVCRLVSTALVHSAIALAVIALVANGPRIDELIFCAALLAVCALALESALIGLVS